nr:immunoglobulin heavy chain junction region [Macaca mulatta]MOV36013.1 immunoglobulin heavy chain junction region [Macaca mulatta]
CARERIAEVGNHFFDYW